MLTWSELQKVIAPTRTYTGWTINPEKPLPGKFEELGRDHLGRMNSNYWFQIKDIWYHKSDIRVAVILAADIVITKDSHGVFRYTKYRGDGGAGRDGQPLNEEELKAMTWIILSAEKV